MPLKIVNPTCQHLLGTISTTPLETKQSQTVAKCQREVITLVTQQPLMKVAGKLALFIDTWRLLTSNFWVIETIKAFQIPFVSIPTQSTRPPMPVFPAEQAVMIREEISTLLMKGAIVRTPRDHVGLFSLSSAQKEWSNETSNKPEVSEPVGKDQALQDGRYAHPPASVETRGLDGEGEPKRCLLHSSNSFQASKVCKVYSGGSGLPVYLPTIRPLMGWEMNCYQQPTFSKLAETLRNMVALDKQ